MGQTLQKFTGRPRFFKEEEYLLRYAWDALQSKAVNKIIIVGETVHKEYYTPLVIACMHRDLTLVRELIKEGADVNLCPQANEFASEDGVPPLYYATAGRDGEIVSLLLNAGANVNGNKRKMQRINLQKPMEELYSNFETHLMSFSRSCERFYLTRLLDIVELYLAAGAKLNSTRWGPCLFYGRGRVFEADQYDNRDTYFKCHTAILLLQHGVDPNLYRLKDVLFQFSEHERNRYSCVSFVVFLETFLGAGYNITIDDRNNRFFKERLRRYDISIDEPFSLKQLCRSHIRIQLSAALNDSTMFTAIEKLPLPTSLKGFLKLQDIIDLDKKAYYRRCPFPDITKGMN